MRMYQYFPYSLSHSFSLDPSHFILHFIREALMHTKVSLASRGSPISPLLLGDVRLLLQIGQSWGVANLTQTISVICPHLFSVSGQYQPILLEQNLTHLVQSPE